MRIADGSCTEEMSQTRRVMPVKTKLLSLLRHNHLISLRHMEILGHLLVARLWICKILNLYHHYHNSFSFLTVNLTTVFLYCIIFLYNSNFINFVNNKSLADQCDSFENGICDDSFNSNYFWYDGGVSLRHTDCITIIFCKVFH